MSFLCFFLHVIDQYSTHTPHATHRIPNTVLSMHFVFRRRANSKTHTKSTPEVPWRHARSTATTHDSLHSLDDQQALFRCTVSLALSNSPPKLRLHPVDSTGCAQETRYLLRNENCVHCVYDGAACADVALDDVGLPGEASNGQCTALHVQHVNRQGRPVNLVRWCNV